MKIEAETFYPERADCPVLGVLGKRQTRAKHRHLGIGCPYHKVGGRVVYSGKDVLDHLKAQRIEPQAALAMHATGRKA